MYNQSDFINIYNSFSGKNIDHDTVLEILPKLNMIIEKYSLSNEEISMLIDVLITFKENNELDKINPESIDLVIRIINNGTTDIKEALSYILIDFSTILKNVLLSFEKNVCLDENYLIAHLSGFEHILEFMRQMLNEEDLETLDKYNHDLHEILVRYKECLEIYKRKKINNDILLGMISRLASMLYFNLDDFECDYDLLTEAINNISSDNPIYQKYVNYCYDKGIYINYTRKLSDFTGIGVEYIVCNEMLEFLFKHKKEDKRKCYNE